MKYRFLISGAAAAMALSASPAMASDCSDLLKLKLHGVTFTKAEQQGDAPVPADPMSAMTGGSPRPVAAGPHCLVEGRIADREGVGGHYAIRFQMRMPGKWNGRFLFQGGGGTDGFIAPAIGAVPSTGSTAAPALQRGYAVVSMDSGHDKPNLDFAADQQAVLDLAYASIGKVTDTAKALIRAHYGRAPRTSYFMGCSNGGREAMQAAMRFPTEFDGVVAGNPGFHLTRAALGSVWDVRHFQTLTGQGPLNNALTQSDLDLVSSAVLRQCDELDGLKDGIVAAFGQCHFDPEVLRAKLGNAKLGVLLAVMGGAHDGKGNAVYTGWPWDPGINSAGWRAWKLGSEDRPAMHLSLSVPSTEALFLTPRREIGANPDYGQLARGVAQVGGYFDADETFLSTFVQRGGKMVIFQGAADPIFSANDIVRWYGEATAESGPDFARLFVVPGMTHCGGGPAFEDFDPLTALENWSATGEAPLSMPAKAPSMPSRSMPICAYPAYARYEGGDVNEAASYRCVTS